MKLEGIIVNGQVELDEPTDLPEGTRVTVEPASTPTNPAPERPAIPATRPDGTPLTELNKALLALAGLAKGLPPDMSINHDHYIHGAKKRKP